MLDGSRRGSHPRLGVLLTLGLQEPLFWGPPCVLWGVELLAPLGCQQPTPLVVTIKNVSRPC